jgi:hypothetical protein
VIRSPDTCRAICKELLARSLTMVSNVTPCHVLILISCSGPCSNATVGQQDSACWLRGPVCPKDTLSCKQPGPVGYQASYLVNRSANKRSVARLILMSPALILRPSASLSLSFDIADEVAI